MKRGKGRVVALAILVVLIPMCGPAERPAAPSAAAPPSAQRPPAVGGEYGTFSWRRFAGAEVTVLIAEHRVTDGMRKVVGEFEALTGIKVNVEALAEDLYFDRMELALRAREGVADAYFLPMDSTAYTQWTSDLILPLDPFLNDPAMTMPGYDLADFPPGFLAAAQYPPGSAEKQTYGIPVSFEAYILFYNKNLVEKHLDGRLPATMDALVAAAKDIKAREDGMVAGAVMRGIRSDTIMDTVTGMIFNRWGAEEAPLPFNVWFDGDWAKPRITDPRIAAGLADYAGMMQAGPMNIQAVDWPEASLLFSQGRAAFFIDASLFGPGFEDAAKSAIAGKVGYAPLPPPQAGAASYTGHWMWGLGIPRNARQPEAAWLFIQWFTSKEIEPRVGAFHGGAARLSTWSNPVYTEALNPEYVEAVQTAMQSSRTTVVFRNGWKAYALEIAGAIQGIYAGQEPAEATAELQQKFLQLGGD